jgi:hypothetical protein
MLTPLRLTLKKQNFMGGDSPGFSDYIVFGSFQWGTLRFGFFTASDKRSNL